VSSLPGYNEAICCLVYLTFSPPSSVRPKVMPMKHEYVKMAKLRMTVVYLAANTQAFARTTMIAFLKTPVETMLPASGIIIPLEQGHVLEKVHGECAIYHREHIPRQLSECFHVHFSEFNGGPVQEDSCSGIGACFDNQGAIGPNSCIDVESCFENLGEQIGSGSCQGSIACKENTGSISENSCTTLGSCSQNNGDIGNSRYVAKYVV